MMSIELRPWTLADAPALREAYVASDDLAAQFGDLNLASLERCERLIVENLAADDAGNRSFAISVDGFAVGNVGIGAIEHRHDTAWLYYWVAASQRGRGLASRALATAAALAFAELGLHRLELGHRTNNPASCAVASRAGFRAEGIEREKLRYGTARFDVETHARLATDPPPALELLPLRVG